jgi:hypothetical protein
MVKKHIKAVDTIDKSKLKEIWPVLNLIKTAKPISRKALLQCLNTTTRKCLYACITNCLKNKSISSKKRKHMAKSLSKHKKNLRFLSSLGDSPAKKKVLVQTGGALPAILASVIPLLASLFMK